MSENPPRALKASTRIVTGVLMLVAGVVCLMLALMLSGALGFGLIIPLFAAPVLVLVGVSQVIHGLRERAV